MEAKNIITLLKNNEYPGRGIIAGRSEDGRDAVIAYFITGRSENSRSRVFAEKDGAIYTEPYDISRVTDPSLIIYPAVKRYKNKLIVTNGDQTDTIYEGLVRGRSFSESLAEREYEPDAPHYTPRISCLLTFSDGDFSYEMSILKRVNGGCGRYFFSYPSSPGEGRYIRTYKKNGRILKPFEGEPVRVRIKGDADAFSESIWRSLDQNNKISLYTEFIDLKTGETTKRIINKNERI